MSNSLAIGAVTATLRFLLDQGVAAEAGTGVTTLPPDKAQSFGQGDGPGRINLFLYQTQFNSTFRNGDMPRKANPNETGQPPLALDLYYLVSAHEKQEGDPTVLAHRLLGRAMAALHDHPLLGADEIRNALPENDLADQIERVRITPQPLSLEELSKLWMIFQTAYRISAAYQVSVVLIESMRPSHAALPVLARGENDQGPTADAGVSLPMLEKVLLPNQQSSLVLGDQLVLIGRNFGDFVGVQFTLVDPMQTLVKTILVKPPTAVGTDAEVRVTLANDAVAGIDWVSGSYKVAIVVGRGSRFWTSQEEASISLAPRIESISPANVLVRDATGHVTLSLTCSPPVRLAADGLTGLRFDQEVFLLLGPDRRISPRPLIPPAAPTPLPKSTDTLDFEFEVAVDQLGEYVVRLRVDGVDQPLVDRSLSTPKFDARHKVTIT